MPRASRAKCKQGAAVQRPSGHDNATSPEPVEQEEVAPEYDEMVPEDDRPSSFIARVRVLPVHRTPRILLVLLAVQRYLIRPERVLRPSAYP